MQRLVKRVVSRVERIMIFDRRVCSLSHGKLCMGNLAEKSPVEEEYAGERVPEQDSQLSGPR